MTAELMDGRSTLDEVVDGLHLPFSGAVLAGALRDLADRGMIRNAGSDGLSARDVAYIDEHSGIQVEDSALERSLSRTLAQAVVVRAEALTTADVAALLGVDASRVRHMVAAGRLMALPRAGRSRRFPAWQLAEGALLPGLAEVLEGMPAGLDAVSAARFMGLATDELTVDGRAATPRQWLLTGGDPAVVLELAGGMDGPF